MKTLTLALLAILFSSLSVFANNDEAVFSTSVLELDPLHTRIAYTHAAAPVQITVFNQEEGIVFSQTTSESDFSTDLDLLDFNSGNYTVLIETGNEIITRQLAINKAEILLQVTVLSEEDGIVSTEVTTAENLATAIQKNDLEAGEYLLIVESNDTVLTKKTFHVK